MNSLNYLKLNMKTYICETKFLFGTTEGEFIIFLIIIKIHSQTVLMKSNKTFKYILNLKDKDKNFTIKWIITETTCPCTCGTTTMVIILLEFFMFCQIFLSPQVKRSLIISNRLVYTSCLTSCRTT